MKRIIDRVFRVLELFNFNPESPEAVKKRYFQEDPIIMYLIVRESLGMSTGKIAAQCAHGSLMVFLQYMKEHSKYQTDPKLEGVHPTDEELDRWEPLEYWLRSSFRKVVLVANDKEWELLKEHLEKDNYVVVRDAGLTEVDPGSETVLALFPMYKSEVPNVIKYLRTLK